MQAVNTTCSQWLWRAQSSELQAAGRVKVMFISSWASLPMEEKSGWIYFSFDKERQESIFIILWDLNESWHQTHSRITFQRTKAGLLPLWDFRNNTSSELDSESCSPGRATKRQAERGHFQPGLGVLSKSLGSTAAGKLWGRGYYHHCVSICIAHFHFQIAFTLYLLRHLKCTTTPWHDQRSVTAPLSHMSKLEVGGSNRLKVMNQ